MSSSPPLLRARPSRGRPRARRASQKAKERIIIAVSRKEVPRAVNRNRIRRRIRAALTRIGAKPKVSVMLSVSARAATAPFPELLEETRKIIRHYE